jgi:hypothetical protein
MNYRAASPISIAYRNINDDLSVGEKLDLAPSEHSYLLMTVLTKANYYSAFAERAEAEPHMTTLGSVIAVTLVNVEIRRGM